MMNKRSTCLGVKTIRLSLYLSCSIISIAVCSYYCQLPNCNLFTQHSCLSSFGRETSLVKVMGPRSIFPPLFTPLIFIDFVYFPLQITTTIFTCVLILCKQQDQRD